jgi:hypothetical protein
MVEEFGCNKNAYSCRGESHGVVHEFAQKLWVFLIISLESLKSIDPMNLTWDIIAIKLLNEEFMKKEKVGANKASINLLHPY